ncbi:telomere length regulation protein [Vermiconidia calcicola]|uniref:Telomere length regulation protein n=1 Tax=Vermiconidia calcicola TaxID=1690605 RepID=A0ACC3MNM6_9PEZI|nr:telomere length regulation protein [Vermiconidia calcicola]
MSLKRPLTTLINLPVPLRPTTHTHTRSLHRLNATTQRIPTPTPFVPDVPTFLTLIGRNLQTHAAKIPTWEALFTLTSQQLRESGVEPPRARRYLLWWRERFRKGVVGIGGDLRHVRDGKAELRVVETESGRSVDRVGTLTRGPGMRKVVVNMPSTSSSEETASMETETEAPPNIASPPPQLSSKEAERTAVSGVKIIHGSAIGGRGVQAVKGQQGVAVLKVQEGLWEQKRGHKVDGGERRKEMVRAKRRVQERKMAR